MLRHWLLCQAYGSTTPGRRVKVIRKFVTVAELLVSYGDLEGAWVILDAFEDVGRM